MLVRFLAVFACGLAAAASIGKLVPHLKWMAERFDVPLAASGFAVSAVMLPGVLLGPVLGLAVDRAGAKRVALAGLGLQACASLALAFAASFPVLVAVRIVEGFGYSIAVVAATVLVVESAGPRHQTFALAVWSAFAPLGFALGQWFAGAISEPNPLPLVGEAHALALAPAPCCCSSSSRMRQARTAAAPRSSPPPCAIRRRCAPRSPSASAPAPCSGRWRSRRSCWRRTRGSRSRQPPS